MPGRAVHLYQFVSSDSNLHLPFVPYTLPIPEGRENHRHCLSLPGRLEHPSPSSYLCLCHDVILSGCQSMVNNEKYTLRSGYAFFRLLVSGPIRQIARQNPEEAHSELVGNIQQGG